MTNPTIKEMDTRGLFEDSYIIEGITEGECRSIFLDWAIGIPAGQDPKPWLTLIHAHYAPLNPEHPMTKVLTESLDKPQAAKRRGGRSGRVIEGRNDA